MVNKRQTCCPRVTTTFGRTSSQCCISPVIEHGGQRGTALLGAFLEFSQLKELRNSLKDLVVRKGLARQVILMPDTDQSSQIKGAATTHFPAVVAMGI